MKKIILLVLVLIFGNGSAFAAESPKLEDIQVVTQEGKKVKFYSDLVKGKKVAINFIYTTCKMICSPMAASLSGLNNLLKEEKKAGDYQLISITLDPASDTPEKMADFAKKHNRSEGWTLVTGEPESIKKVLKSLGGWAPNAESHAPLTIMGDDNKNVWKKVYGIKSSKTLKDEFFGLVSD